MTDEEIDVNFEELRDAVALKKRASPLFGTSAFDRRPTAYEIGRAEQHFGAKLPKDYLDVVSEFGGGSFMAVDIWSLDPASPSNIIEMNKKCNKWRNRYVLVSENGCGDFYGFKISSGACDPELYFWDHEIDEWSEASYSGLLEYIAEAGLSIRPAEKQSRT